MRRVAADFPIATDSPSGDTGGPILEHWRCGGPIFAALSDFAGASLRVHSTTHVSARSRYTDPEKMLANVDT